MEAEGFVSHMRALLDDVQVRTEYLRDLCKTWGVWKSPTGTLDASCCFQRVQAVIPLAECFLRLMILFPMLTEQPPR